MCEWLYGCWVVLDPKKWRAREKKASKARQSMSIQNVIAPQVALVVVLYLRHEHCNPCRAHGGTDNVANPLRHALAQIFGRIVGQNLGIFCRHWRHARGWFTISSHGVVVVVVVAIEILACSWRNDSSRRRCFVVLQVFLSLGHGRRRSFDRSSDLL